MKIVQLSYSLSSGGGERFVVDLSNRLAENPANEVILITTDDERNPKNIHYLNDLSQRVRFVNLHCHSGQSIKSFIKVYEFIKSERPDLVHAHCNILLLYLPAFLICKVKYVHTLHNLAKVCLKYKWCKPFNKILYKNRIQPITISKTCQKSYIELYGLHNAVCITNGREPLMPSGKIPHDIEFISDDIPIFIHIARCALQKNQHRLFNTFDRLQAEGVKFHLIVIGSNYEKVWSPKYSNNSQIHILGERKNIADYMANADYFVLSSDYEGLPLTLLEAMSLGVIPICTPAGGVVDVIQDGINGYLSTSFNDDSFYNKIKQALSERGKIDRIAIKAEYKEKYSMKTCAEKYYDIYKKLLENEL